MSTPIVTVTGKGGPLTIPEFDQNLVNLRDAADNAASAVAGWKAPFIGPISMSSPVCSTLTSSCNLLILGDSITYGVGATTFKESWGYRFCRSVWNAISGNGRTPYGYQTTFSMDRALQETGVTSTGSISSSGVVNSRLTLSAGQTLTVTAHAIDYLDVIYDASSSSGSLVFKKNGGSAYATKTVSGTGLQSTFPTAALGTIESDTLTITASGGTVVITGILKYKTAVGGNSPKIFIGGWSGTAYQDYTSSASLTELAYYLNFFTSGSDPKTCLFMLGTNNIYSGTKALSPAAMISQIQTVIAGLNARSSTVSYVLSVPPKASGVWPIIVGGYTYQNYVDAIVSFAQANNYGMIRNDIGDLSNSTHYADGVHPDSLGHLVMAQTVCAAFGIPLNDYIKTAQTASETAAAAAAALVAGFFTPIVADITMNSTWRPFGNVTANRGMVMKQSNLVVQISGIVEPNGSVSTVVGTLPAAYRPTRSVFFVCSTNAGPVSAYIDTSGNINLGAVPTTWLSLESVTFHVNRP